MDHRSACRQAAAAIEAARTAGRSMLVGFDGFVDNIIAVVDKRLDATRYEAMPDITTLAGRIAAAAGQSANFELVVKQSKIGGNGPIMANALLGYGTRVTYAGVIGSGAGASDVDPVFAPLAAGAAQIIALGAPAVTDALEFRDGKLMLGKLTPLEAISVASLRARLDGGLRQSLATSDAIATVNWTMTMAMTAIWRWLAAEVLPGLRKDRPRWFIDLADPAKRTVADLREACAAMQELQRHADVVLGMNGSEGRQVLAALGSAWEGGHEDTGAAQRCAEEVRRRLGISVAMVHLVGSAACADAKGGYAADGFACAAPKITTGAGDHFNAGFLTALAAGLGGRDCLLVGGATSGHYVRTAQSPRSADTAAFLRKWADSPGA